MPSGPPTTGHWVRPQTIWRGESTMLNRSWSNRVSQRSNQFASIWSCRRRPTTPTQRRGWPRPMPAANSPWKSFSRSRRTSRGRTRPSRTPTTRSRHQRSTGRKSGRAPFTSRPLPSKISTTMRATLMPSPSYPSAAGPSPRTARRRRQVQLAVGRG